MIAYLCSLWTTYFGPTLTLLVPVVIATVTACGAVALIGSRTNLKRFPEIFFAVSPYAWLGTVLGTVAGTSQQPVVSAFLSGTLTLVAALLSYLFAKQPDAANKSVEYIPAAITLLCISAFIGIATGRAYKGQWDEFDAKDARWKVENEQIYLPMRKLQAQYEYCRKVAPETSKAKCDEILTK